MVIHYIHKGYPEKRNILYNHKVHFSQSIDIFKLICHFSFKILKSIPTWALNLYFNPFSSKKRLLHFFNGICLSNQLWITTFETALPRLGKVPKWIQGKVVKKLTKRNCVKLVALSSCTYNIQRNYLKQNWPDLEEEIMHKTIILHPPQNIFFNDIKTKPDPKDVLIFTFVGNQFFGKGGREILDVFTSLSKQGYKFKLNIISNFHPDSYASGTTNEDVQALKERFSELPETIQIIGSLPNNKVIEILKQSHIGLLPTYADTYGYFVLEAQACGCPVISTDIRALPEINNNQCGWLISVPKDKNGNGILRTQEDRQIFSETIHEKLLPIVKDILDNPESIISKALASIERIKNEHNPEKHASTLTNIYNKAKEL